MLHINSLNNERHRLFALIGWQAFLLSLCIAGPITLSKIYSQNYWVFSIFTVPLFGGALISTLYNTFFRKKITTYDNKDLYAIPPEYQQYPPKEYLRNIKMSNPNDKEDTVRAADTNYLATASDGMQKQEPVTCYFSSRYYDLQLSRIVDFHCNEVALEKGFCRFHEKSLYEKNPLDNTANEKINRLIEDRLEVFCMGYYIGFLSIRGKRVYKPIHFHGTTIKVADFRETYFTEEATAFLVDTTFEEVSFEGAIFNSQVWFNNSTVIRSSKTQGYFQEWEKFDLENCFTGYISLKNAEFYDKANFQGSKIYGRVVFDDAKFFDGAIFDYCVFYTDDNHKPVFAEVPDYGNLSMDYMGGGSSYYNAERL